MLRIGLLFLAVVILLFVYYGGAWVADIGNNKMEFPIGLCGSNSCVGVLLALAVFLLITEFQRD